ncbi:MAG: hypothetical protein RIQ72_20 [Candidatus Parcubacteria bacterium]|jgi:hypothetical protein
MAGSTNQLNILKKIIPHTGPLKKETVKISLRLPPGRPTCPQIAAAPPPAAHKFASQFRQGAQGAVGSMNYDPTRRWKNEFMTLLPALVLCTIWASLVCREILTTSATSHAVFAMAHAVAFVPFMAVLILMVCLASSIINHNRRTTAA